MSPIEVGIFSFILVMTLVFLGVHVAFALIVVGFFGLVILMGLRGALFTLAIVPFYKLSNYDISVIPPFILMGAIVSSSNIGRDAYVMVRAWVGRVRGGLAIATTGACGIFAACCGSSLASALAMGKIAYPEMKRNGYSDTLSLGTIAAGGTIGILIPPSMGFILIGILTEVSIGKLFMAGIIPGILEVLFYAATIMILCRVNPNLAPVGEKTTMTEKVRSLRLTWPVLLLFLLVMGGIYGGVFTPTEAGGIGAFGAFIISLARKELTRQSFFDALIETVKLSSMIMALIAGAFIFNKLLAVSRLPYTASEFVVTLKLNKYVILLLIIFLYLILGMVFDVFAIIILTVPIIFPTMISLGFNPLWYGVIMVRMCEIGLITPPFGINLFGLAGVIDVPIGTLYRGVIPFFIADLFHLTLLIAVPAISTFIPETLIAIR